MPTAYRVTRGGNTSGAGAATAPVAYNEPLVLRDTAAWGVTRNEPLKMRDAMLMGVSRAESLRVQDAYSVTATRTENDNLKLDDTGAYTLTDLIVGRSGTPDTDQMSDAWIDQTATTTNHGNESIQVKGVSTAPGSDEKRGFIQLDLTRVTGHSAATAGATLTIIASHTGLVATNLTLNFATQATRWFTESTLTWNTRPTGSITALPAISVAAGAAASYAITISQTNLAAMLGKWVLILMQSPTAAVPPTFTILSRDNATASNRPKFTAALTIT